MPAHKLPPGMARTVPLALRQTPGEAKALEAAAKASHLPTATYAQNVLRAHLLRLEAEEPTRVRRGK